MTSRLAVRIFGWGLVLAGSGALVWIVSMAARIDALAPDLYYAQPDSGLGYGELELWVRDLRLAPLTVVAAGVAALLALRLAAGRGRHVLAVTGLVLLCSPVLMGEFVAYGDWVGAAMPTAYVVAVPSMQLALTASGLAALLLAARRVSRWHVATIVAAVALATWMVGWDESQWSWLLFVWPVYVGLATSAAVAGELTDPGTPRRAVTAGVAAAVAFLPVAWVICIPLNFAIGAAVLELNGGHIDVDGLPVYLVGPLSAVVAALAYLTAVNHWSILIPKEQRRSGASPAAA